MRREKTRARPFPGLVTADEFSDDVRFEVSERGAR
jgi:hypothetical protein